VNPRGLRTTSSEGARLFLPEARLGYGGVAVRRLAALLSVLAATRSASAAETVPARAAPTTAPTIFSTYEKETIDRALARHALTTDPEPEGKRIESIAIEVLDVIEDRDPLPGVLNALHCTTRQHAIRRDLLFSAGQRYEKIVIDETERNLRALRQQSLVVILPIRGTTPDSVRVLVLVKDVWSLRLNTSYRITGQGLETLYIQPAEENLFGMRRTLSGTFAYDPATLSFGGTFIEPRLADSRILVALSANAIVNHTTGAVEGSTGSFDYGVPIYSTRQDWAWGTSLTWNESVTRRFRGRALNVFNADLATDPASLCPDPTRCIPMTYRTDRITGTTGVSRQWGRGTLQLVQVGVSADRRIYDPGDLSRYAPDAVARFLDERVPTSVTRNGPFVRYQLQQNRFSKMQDVETLGLQENYRLGFEAHARIYPMLEAFGSTTSLIGYSGAVAYTYELGNGLVRLYGAAAVEVTPRHDAVANATLQGGMRLVTPRLPFGRFVYDGTFTARPRNDLNAVSSLGGDGRLRGYLSGSVLGHNMFAANLEYRTRSFQLGTIQVGGALFYDVGDAYDTLADLRPKQGAGAGLRLGFPQLDRTVMRIDLGFPLGNSAPRSSVLDGLVVTFDQAFEMPQVTSLGVVR
jgi:hypothetical protein